MVKICPNCGEKNFDDAKYCMKCNTKIKRVEKLPDKPIIDENDEYSYYKPKGYQVKPGVREYITYPAIIFAVASFFIFSIFTLILAFILSSRSIQKDDNWGYIALGIAFISLILNIVFTLIGIGLIYSGFQWIMS